MEEPAELKIDAEMLEMKQFDRPEILEREEYRPQWRRKEKHRKRQWV
jgi:hypothetical protein